MRQRIAAFIAPTTLIALLFTLAAWSTTFAGLRAVLRFYPVGPFILVRWGIASLALGVYAVATRMRMPEPRDLPRFALAGLLGFSAYQVALGFGQKGTSAGVAAFVTNLGPLFTALLAVALGREKPHRGLWAGLAVCMSGMAVMATGKGAGGLTPSALLVALAAACFAGYVLVSKPLLARYSPMQVTAFAIWFGTIPFLVFAPGVPGAVASAPIEGQLTLLYMALVPGAIAYVTWSRVTAAFPASTAAAFLYLVPVLSLGVAFVWIGEVPGLLTVAGGALLLAGVALTSGLIKMPARRATAPVQPLSVPVSPPSPAEEAA